MRHIRLFPAFLLVGASIASADLLVNTRLQPQAFVAKDSAFQIDLRDFFQHYAEPGPVATFELLMPVQAGWMGLYVETSYDEFGNIIPIYSGPTYSLMTYELTSGETYGHYYAVFPEDFKWRTESVQFQLFPAEVPLTVANFMTYVNDGSYMDTIVHRNITGYDILQAGGFIVYPTDEYFFSYVETYPSVPFEQGRSNSAGTIAMGSTSAFGPATSQFYVNLKDNSSLFGQAYSVFGELIDAENNLRIIAEMGDANIFNLQKFWGDTFRNTPMYTPWYNDQESYLRFPSITVSAGNPDGVSYAWEWLDIDGEEGFDEEELAGQALFNVQIDGSGLSVSRTGGTGTSAIKVTGTSASGTSEFEIALFAYNQAALEKFPSSSIHADGWIDNSWYGWLIADDYPFIRHYNHGYQYVSDTGTSQTFYIYDYRLGSWLYTRSSLYPFLYVYAKSSWFWYQPDSGNGANLARWFWDYSISNWFTDEPDAAL